MAKKRLTRPVTTTKSIAGIGTESLMADRLEHLLKLMRIVPVAVLGCLVRPGTAKMVAVLALMDRAEASTVTKYREQETCQGMRWYTQVTYIVMTVALWELLRTSWALWSKDKERELGDKRDVGRAVTVHVHSVASGTGKANTRLYI